MAELLLLTSTPGGPADVLPSLTLLNHRVRVLPMEPSALVEATEADIVLLDARTDLVGARTTSRLLRATGLPVPLILVLTEGGMLVLNRDWEADDFLLESAPPAEVEARIRLAHDRTQSAIADDQPEQLVMGELVIDASGYAARLRGRPAPATGAWRANRPHL